MNYQYLNNDLILKREKTVETLKLLKYFINVVNRYGIKIYKFCLCIIQKYFPTCQISNISDIYTLYTGCNTSKV